jgi:hypothetical protein
MNAIRFTRRSTTTFLQSIPKNLEHFDVEFLAVVKRKPGKDVPEEKWGTDVRLDPVHFDWQKKAVTITIPSEFNYGIASEHDLHDGFFEAVEAAILTLMINNLP